jgi:hypothetical protein
MDQGAISTFKVYFLRATHKGTAELIQVSINVERILEAI